ncbi:MAG: hypothetical protein ACODAJ_10225, partial [Planctomycetota bacterium]
MARFTGSLARVFALAALAVVALGAPAAAAPVTLIDSNSFGESWDTGGDWSDGQPAQAGNDYHVGDSTGKNLRTPNDVSNPTFPGDSLTIHDTGALAFKHNGTVTIDDLRLDGGKIACWVGNRTMAVGGNLSVLSPSTIEMGGGNTRTTRLESTLTGAAALTLTGSGSPARFILDADTSGYTGHWIVNPALDNLYA